VLLRLLLKFPLAAQECPRVYGYIAVPRVANQLKYMPKPIDQSELARVVNRYLSH
jgi:hypothetical protein